MKIYVYIKTKLDNLIHNFKVRKTKWDYYVFECSSCSKLFNREMQKRNKNKYQTCPFCGSHKISGDISLMDYMKLQSQNNLDN